MAEYVDPYQEVAEAAAKRKAQIREWAAKQVDPTLVVTETPDPEVIHPQKEVANPSPADPVVVEEEQYKQVDSEVPDPGPADVIATEEEIHKQVDQDVEDPGPADEVIEGEEDETDDVQEVEPDSEEEEVDEDDAPAKSANKGEWVAYRIKTHNLTEDQANEYTKDELVEGKF